MPCPGGARPVRGPTGRGGQVSTRSFRALGLALVLALGGAGSGCTPDGPSDEELAVRVEAALATASDLPAGFEVEVAAGVVTITGSLACDDCGGLRTPGGIGTVQQSLGAVVRAVPGVEAVEFALDPGP